MEENNLPDLIASADGTQNTVGSDDTEAAETVNTAGENTENPDAGDENVTLSAAEAPCDDDRAAYDALINSPRFKRFYTEDTQKIINRRFREKLGERIEREKREQLITKISEISGSDDLSALTDGIAVGMGEREILDAYPDAKEKAYSVAAKARLAGISAVKLYEAVNLDGIREEIRKSAWEEFTESLRSRRQRPSENGITERVAVGGKRDVAGFTRDERREIAKRAANGETVIL